MEGLLWGLQARLSRECYKRRAFLKINDGSLLTGRVVAATRIVCGSSMEKMG